MGGSAARTFGKAMGPKLAAKLPASVKANIPSTGTPSLPNNAAGAALSSVVSTVQNERDVNGSGVLSATQRRSRAKGRAQSSSTQGGLGRIASKALLGE